MSLVVRNPAFCICKNKDADQLSSNCEADQRLCFRYTDSTIPLLPKSQISMLYPSSVAVQPGLCRTWSENLKTSFLASRLICYLCHENKGAVQLICTFCFHICKKQVFSSCSSYLTRQNILSVIFIVCVWAVCQVRKKDQF